MRVFIKKSNKLYIRSGFYPGRPRHMLSQIKNEREGCPLIARTETHTDRERILALLSPRSTDACVRQVFSDIDEINRLMEYYSFRTPQLADRFADLLEGRYRYEIFAIYGPSLLLRKSSDSSYLRLDQLLSSLIRVAVLRLCCEGIYSLTSSQIASGDGLLYLALQKQIAG